MGRSVIVVFALGAFLVGCGGSGGPATQAPGAPTSAPGQPTAGPAQPTTGPAQPTPGGAPAPAPGGTTVTVVLTDGPDAGTYTGSGDPGCAFGFMAECAIHAEKLDHHPEWSNVYKTVEVKLTTHSANGLSELDFQLAKKMEKAAKH